MHDSADSELGTCLSWAQAVHYHSRSLALSQPLHPCNTRLFRSALEGSQLRVEADGACALRRVKHVLFEFLSMLLARASMLCRCFAMRDRGLVAVAEVDVILMRGRRPLRLLAKLGDANEHKTQPSSTGPKQQHTLYRSCSSVGSPQKSMLPFASGFQLHAISVPQLITSSLVAWQ